LFALTRRCVEAIRGTDAKIVVNDRVDVALAASAHGVHLRGDSLSPAAARGIVGREMLVGRSVHSASEAIAVSNSVDYLILGTLFQTESESSAYPVLPLEELARASRQSTVPVLAIGGITAERAEAAARAGAAGVAGIGLFIPPRDTAYREHLRVVVGALRSAQQTGVRLGALTF
jgi:thiamine-phosphate pyrophosphorylase